MKKLIVAAIALFATTAAVAEPQHFECRFGMSRFQIELERTTRVMKLWSDATEYSEGVATYYSRPGLESFYVPNSFTVGIEMTFRGQESRLCLGQNNCTVCRAY